MADAVRVLVVDNHDSFVYTLVGYLTELGAVCEVIEADALGDVTDALAAVDGVVISPGPGTPSGAGSSIEVVHEAARRALPLMGVCLGHQAIAVAFGATVGHAPELLHGMTSAVHHDGRGIFAGLPDPFTATRYHSLAIEPASLRRPLRATATTAAGVIMAVAHDSLPIVGVQFHPESVLTEDGHLLLGTWLESIGLAGAAARGAALRPLRTIG